jgi:hypothetical protein
MDIRKAITTRWQRLKLGAGTLSAGVTSAEATATGGPATGGPSTGSTADDHAEVTPFAGEAISGHQASQQPRQARSGLGDLVHSSWKAFFSRFREDEREFELPNYLEAGATVREQLERLGPDRPPDYATCRVMLELLMQFEESRRRDFNDRLDELMASCQQLRAQLDVSELSKCYQEDELVTCLRVLKLEFDKRKLSLPPGPDGLPARAQDLLRHLLAALKGATPASGTPAPTAALSAAALTASAQAAAPSAAPSAAPAAQAAEQAAPVVDIHARDSLDWTKLHSAAFYGRIELVELLLIQGAEINARAKDGVSPLHLAIKKGHLKVAQLLFAKGANLAAKDNQGNTPLHIAADAFSRPAIEALVTMGAYVNVKNLDGWTPLHLAANRGKQEVLDSLIALGAEINAEAGNGWTPLKVAVNCGHFQVAERLRQHGARQ